MANDKPKTDMVKAIDDATAQINEALAKCSSTVLAELPALKQAVTLAAGMQHLRKALTDEIVDKVFMPLQGSPLGFITDKDKDGGYPREIVRECLIEALIKGAQPVNNEFNIIAARCYIAKNGLKRLVQTWPGLSALAISPGVPQMAGDKGALIAMRATWLLNGKAMELYRGQVKDSDGVVDDTRIAVRVNAGMGPDAIIGKAERKLYKAIYELLTGGAVSIEDNDAIDAAGESVPASPTPPAPAATPGAQAPEGKAPAPKREPGDDLPT